MKRRRSSTAILIFETTCLLLSFAKSVADARIVPVGIAVVVEWSWGRSPGSIPRIPPNGLSSANRSRLSRIATGDGKVTVDEVTTAVNIALNRELPTEGCASTLFCPDLDSDLDCQITLPEILAAVTSAQEGCQ